MVFMVFSLPQTLVKTLAKNLVKIPGQTPGQQFVRQSDRKLFEKEINNSKKLPEASQQKNEIASKPRSKRVSVSRPTPSSA